MKNTNFERFEDDKGSDMFKLEIGLLAPTGEHKVSVIGERANVIVTLIQYSDSMQDNLGTMIAALEHIVLENGKSFENMPWSHHQLSMDGNKTRVELTIGEWKYNCTFIIKKDEKPPFGYQIVMMPDIVPVERIEVLKLQSAMCLYTKILLESILNQMGE